MFSSEYLSSVSEDAVRTAILTVSVLAQMFGCWLGRLAAACLVDCSQSPLVHLTLLQFGHRGCAVGALAHLPVLQVIFTLAVLLT